jgi:hypothetical protein
MVEYARKKYLTCLQFEYPSFGIYPPMGGNMASLVTTHWGGVIHRQIFQFEQHMTDIITLKGCCCAKAVLYVIIFS